MRTITLSLAAAFAMSAAATAEKPSAENSVIRVNATMQSYNLIMPWQKVAPKSRLGLGAVLPGGKVLVTAQMVTDATYIELEKPDTAAKTIAEVVAVDYEANLAVLSPTADKKFLDDRVPLELAEDLKPGDVVEAWQFEGSGTPVSTKIRISKGEIGGYFLPSAYFLKVQANGPVQYRSGSFTLPVARDGKLAGMLVSYSSKDQISHILPAPIIAHFLKDLEDGEYIGYPDLGIAYAQTLDDQFRKFLKLNGHKGGIYVSKVLEGASAHAAGVKEGDVILSIGGHDIDSRGNYAHPIWGKIGLGHIVRGEAFTGDVLKIEILRKGKKKELDLELLRRNPEDELIDPYSFDKGPRFVVVGGLVFQELSLPFLKLFGNDWQSRAPIKLLMANANPEKYMKQGRRKLVMLTRSIHTPTTLGYAKLSTLIVSKVNGQQTNDLNDLVAALEKPEGGQHRIEFEDFPKLIFLDVEQAEQVNKVIKERFGITQRLD